ncbi:hypothetical protein ABGV43_17170 [Paenibacillus amylolyticus]|uniref:hypothetical protein n=1 Tax=Paenibacillus amylolyticus TaxID=1451 RepID=UPI003242C089
MEHLRKEILRLEGTIRFKLEAEWTSPVEHALRMLMRDIETVLVIKPEMIDNASERANIKFVLIQFLFA